MNRFAVFEQPEVSDFHVGRNAVVVRRREDKARILQQRYGNWDPVQLELRANHDLGLLTLQQLLAINKDPSGQLIVFCLVGELIE